MFSSRLLTGYTSQKNKVLSLDHIDSQIARKSSKANAKAGFPFGPAFNEILHFNENGLMGLILYKLFRYFADFSMFQNSLIIPRKDPLKGDTIVSISSSGGNITRR